MHTYLDNMHIGKHVVAQIGARYQYMLYNLLHNILHQEYPLAAKQLQVMLLYFSVYKDGALGMAKSKRFVHTHWPGNGREKTTYLYLTDLLHLFATTDREKAKKQMNFERLTDPVLTTLREPAKQTIYRYFNVE
jgi:predicted oxidoreductase